MSLQVFISYKSEYRDFARKVKAKLNQWGYDTWLDVDNIQPGEYFRHKIQQGLDESDVLLMVLTSEAQDSREVMSEVDYFLQVGKPVVPLRHRECKPLYIFVSIQYIDFVMNEPNGFTLLRERLKEMTQPVREAAPALEEEAGAKAAADELMTEADELMMEADELMSAAPKPAPEPEPTPEASENEKRRRESVLDDGLFGGAAPQAPAASTSGATPPPAPEISIPMPSKPAAPITVPQPAPASREGLYPGAAPQRKSASVPMWAVGAVATILIVVAGIVLISPMSGALPQPAGRADIPPLLIVGAVVVVVGGLGLWWWRGRSSPRRSSALPDATVALSNRQQMLAKVETFWIQGVLEKALEAGRLDIGLASAPGTVLRHKDYGDYHLPAEMNILDVFNDLNRELLILGAPGGGKTVLLLQLAEKLLQQARSAPDKAMPVVFNLSSWAAERKPLGEWLVDELRQKYQIPKAVAQEWVEGEQLLLLLDGLDEVAAAYREASVEAINAFRQQYRTVDLAVCSRSEDYEALTAKLDVRGAVVLDALHEDQINDYLNRPALEALRAAMADDPELRDMSRVPFLLNAMAYAYAGETATTLRVAGGEDAAARRTHLFDLWVEKRLKAAPSEVYTPERVKGWLTWLAGKMTSFKSSVFYIETLQPTWLESRSLQVLYRFVIGVAISLMAGIALQIVLGPLIGLVLGVAIGLINVSIYYPIVTVDLLRWRLNRYSILAGIITGTAIFVSFSSIFSPYYGAVFGSVIGMMTGFIFGLTPQANVNVRTLPNIGIRHSGINALKTLSAGLIAGIIAILVASIVIGKLDQGLNYFIEIGFLAGIGYGLAIGWAYSLIRGGSQTVIKHVLIRFILYSSGHVPMNYARFLDYCVQAGLMRQVGGGYLFAHRYLLEYFAGLK